ncbi:unnamed protein product [Cuscuta campestris]|uniref:Reverse transcriptase domain-containing protein n=1 Tax=Cuscuta campestris TaxID=132261 RepID=A0A484LB76_9ASTE|nr:unnamed protein product [Cuscuta campestris]
MSQETAHGQGSNEHVSVHTEASSFTPPIQNEPINQEDVLRNNANAGGQPDYTIPVFLANLVQQVANAPMFPPQPPPPPRVITFKFLKDNGAEEFLGDRITEPQVAWNWIEQTARVLRDLNVPLNDYPRFVAQLLRGEAYEWWKRTDESNETPKPWTWEFFNWAFKKEYIPARFREEKRTEFVELRQGDMTLPKYRQKFVSMAKFALTLVSTMTDRIEEFRSKLRPDLRAQVSVIPTVDFTEAYDLIAKVDKDLNACKEYLKKEGLCLGCGKPGHFRKNCPTNPGEPFPPASIASQAASTHPAPSQHSTTGSNPVKNQNQQQGQAPSRTYSMKGRTKDNPDVIQGMFSLFDTVMHVLIDPGSTLSYIYVPMPDKADILKENLEHPILVSNPLGHSMSDGRYYPSMGKQRSAQLNSRTILNSDGKLYPSLFKPWSNIITWQNALTQRWEALPIDALTQRWEGSEIKPSDKSSFKGCPSVSFSKEEVEALSNRFRFALIGRFRRRPPIAVVKNFLTRLGLAGGFTLGELNSNSILINFEQDEDYQRLFLRKSWTLGKEIMLGKPLKVDNATLNFSRPKAARVCIEIDVSKYLHQKIHVKHIDEDLFFQVLYEDPPSFCDSCHRLGHNATTCKAANQLEVLYCKDSWEEIPFHGGMQILFKRLHHLKEKLSSWNKTYFGKIFNMIKEAEDEATKAEQLFEENPSTDNKILYNQTVAEHQEIIEQSHNEGLMSLPTEDKIKLTVWNMEPNSSPGPDGFNINFFKHCWDIIEGDITSACQEVFLGIPLPKAASSSNICLLPKGAYVPRREIMDQILITKEMVHHINRKARGGNLIVKLDMAKAFDKLKWSYLLDILKAFGFSPQFIQMVNNLLASSKYSILINGKPCGYFGQSRGIKQGDPLCPLLFIISNEGFSRNLNKMFLDGFIDRFNSGRKSIPITHLSYGDDIIIFSSGNTRSIANLKRFLNEYQLVSGQTINYSKRSFMMGSKPNSLAISKLERLLGMSHKTYPFTYLGIPIDLGITRQIHCANLISSFDTKLNGWYQKNLDQAGRLVLINHVLNTLPNYFLASNTMPKSIKRLLDQKMARFWWGGKHHWISWQKLCAPKEEGGLGTRDFKSLENAFSLKLWWKYHNDNGLWARLMKAKYWRNGEMKANITDSPVWKRIFNIEDTAIDAYSVSDDGMMHWKLDPNGSFTLRSAYELCRDASTPMASFKYLWESPQNPNISIFTWKLFRHCIPTLENLQKLGFLMPSMCPFCKGDSYDAKHFLIDCHMIRGIWHHFSACVGILHHNAPTINQHFLNWWLRGNNTIYDFLRMHMPGIISWHIWKALNSLIYEDNSSFNPSKLIDSISRYIKSWLQIKLPKHLRIYDAWLMNAQIQPKFQSSPKIRVVKWLAPPKGRLKLNVDASFSHNAKHGAAILRDDQGRFVCDLGFEAIARGILPPPN